MAQVYAAVAQANRLRVITKLSVSTTTSSAIKSPAIFYIKGGSHQVRRWTDTEIAFRQVK